MPCYCPLTAYYSKEVGSSGKRGITFNRGASFSGVPIRVPCGQCIGCRLEKSRQWAMRCVHEAQLHKDNIFVTLTYDDKHLPPGGSLVKRDLQLFMKRLRHTYQGVRFYACGEYGEHTFRPHYHAILFNCAVTDPVLYKRNDANPEQNLYSSATLNGIWDAGMCLFGAVTFDSAAYVARYCLKKVTGDGAKSHYERVSTTGEVYDLVPEFTVMSRRPGIGSGWFAKYGKHSYAHDAVVMNGKEVRPPRFYDTRFEVLDAERLATIKVKRRRKASEFRSDNTPDRRRVREIVTYAGLSQKGRTSL